MNIIRLGSNDLEQMRDLLMCYSRAFEEQDLYSRAPPDDDYLVRFLSREHVVVLAALDGSQVVAGITAYVLEKPEMRRSKLYLYDLAVDYCFRRQGIATALIEKLCETGKRLGAYEIFVQADYIDKPAVALYSKLGAREDVIHFSIATS